MVRVAGFVLCPECGSKMHKAGTTWSGRTQKPIYRCPKCGRRAVAESEK